MKDALVTTKPSWFDTSKKFEGVTSSDTELLFDTSHFTQEKAEKWFRDNEPFTEKAARKINVGAYKPTPQDLPLLKAALPNAPDYDKFNVFTFSAANNIVDYEQDRLTQPFLQKLADFINTKGPIANLMNHDNALKVGVIYQAQVVPMQSNPGYWELEVKVAVAPEIEVPGRPGMTIERAFQTRVLDFVSIRFMGPKRYLDEGGKSIREFIVNDADQESMITEISWVYFGGQRDARVKKEFTVKNFNNNNSKKMSKKLFQIKTDAKVYDIDVTAEGESITATGIEALQAEVTAKDATIKALTERVTKALKPTIDNIQNLQGEKGLNKSFKQTEAQLQATEPDHLYAMEKDLMAEFAAKNPSGQIDKTGTPDTEKKGEKETNYGAY